MNSSYFLCSHTQSDGVEQTNYLAQHYCQEAIRQISRLRPSTERDALIQLTELVLRRDKWAWTQSSTLRQLHLCRALLGDRDGRRGFRDQRITFTLSLYALNAEPWPPLTSAWAALLVQKQKLCEIIVIQGVAQMEVLPSRVGLCGSVTDDRWNIRPHYVFVLVNVLLYQVLNNNRGLKPHWLFTQIKKCFIFKKM